MKHYYSIILLIKIKKNIFINFRDIDNLLIDNLYEQAYLNINICLLVHIFYLILFYLKQLKLK